MLSHYYHFEKYIKQIQTGPAGLYLDGFATALWEAGYSETTARHHIRAAQHLVHWAQQQQVHLAKIDDALVERFRRHLRQCRCRPYGSSHPGGSVKGALLFLGHLESINVIPTRVKINQKPETPALLYLFRQWMRSNRNIGEATLYNYSLAVGDLLQSLGENPSHFDVQRIRQFVIDRNRRCGRAKVQNMVTALRAFVRYLINIGLCPVGLDAAILTPAHWHLSNLPRYLQVDEVERIVSACSPVTAVGRRDRAIVLLLARLALRAGDIVHLQLDDIDWVEGWIRVCGKGRRENRLPLLREVGEAIIAYLTGSRPTVNSASLFLRSHAPLKGFANHSAISVIVAKAMRRAGIAGPLRGAAHVLRHTAATAMLREGASLQDIAVILRQRSIETTSIYAKVDVSALREIAQSWPGEVVSC